MAQHPDGSTLVPRHGPDDPRIYAEGGSVDHARSFPPARGAQTALLSILLEQSDTRAQRETWRRDLGAWLAKKQAAKPEKVREFCKALGISWIEGLRDAGYSQHLISLIDECLRSGAYEIARPIALFTFTYWVEDVDDHTKVYALSTLEDELRAVEHWLSAASAPWGRGIPVTVKPTKRTHVAMRTALRLADGGDVEYMTGDLSDVSWPPAVVGRPIQHLIGCSFEGAACGNPYEPALIRQRYFESILQTGARTKS